MTENNQIKNNSGQHGYGLLRGLKKKIILRAVFSVVTLLLTAVLLFSLTAAWFTNVADTGGLTFVAKQWDFNGSIIIDNNTISMSPGDSGTVSMQIINNGAETASAGVTVSKSSLSEQMKQRLYFYVDTPFYRNAERMDRVYVTESGGYTYTVFSGSQIYITEASQNAPALKWEWVYDVLGYYVRGHVTDSSAQIDEYIRPIEYDYDPIKTTFTDSGELKTVDGVKTVSELLRELSATDGYADPINEKGKTNGYYPVSVNSDGYGVWAYLCNYNEIIANMEYDTEIGATESAGSYPVEICVTGSNSKETAIDVGNTDTLVSILNSTAYASIKLTDDIVIDGELVIKSGYRADIDLNGHTITSSSDSIVSAEVGSKITITNGEIRGNGKNYGVKSSGAEVVFSNVTMTEVNTGVRISDNENDIQADSRLHIVDSKISANDIGLWMYANDGDTGTDTTVIIERSEIVGSGYAGISFSGNYGGTDTQISECTVKGYYTSIYHPQPNSVLNIDRSELEGITGIVVKGGKVNINDSRVSGIGTPEQISAPAYSQSGFTDTGDGIYLEANYAWTAEVNVTGSNTVVTSANAMAVRKYMADETGASITLSGGAYSSDVSTYLADGATQSLDEASGKYIVSLSE